MTSQSKPAMRTWLELIRLPAVFTAIADALAGYLVADGGWVRAPIWIGVLCASVCFYWAGMVLNDVFDIEVDRRERPSRPLPSGRVSLAAARNAGVGLLAAGLLIVWLVVVPMAQTPLTGMLACALVACILLYNRVLKATLAGPVAMGLCRAVNLAMAMSVSERVGLWQSSTPWLVAGGIGLYVMGVTWFARSEAEQESPRHFLFGGLVLMLLGVMFIVVFPIADRGFARRVVFTNDWIWPLMICLLTGPVWRHGVGALVRPTAKHVQTTIGQALMTIISLDAAVALIVAGPIAALIILALKPTCRDSS